MTTSKRKSTIGATPIPVSTSPVKQFFGALISSYPSKRKEPQPRKFNPEIIRRFAKDMGFDLAKGYCPPVPELEEATVRIFRAQTTEQKYLKTLMRVMPLATTFAELAYPDHTLELKIYNSVYTSIIIYLDDTSEQEPELLMDQLREFVSTYGTGGLDHPVLALLHHYLTVETPKFFGPIISGCISKATMDFLIGLMIETKFPNGLDVPKSSARFPSWLRDKTGDSEAYSSFVYPNIQFSEEECLETFFPTIVDLVELTNGINDVVSFYKEAVVGTEYNVYFMNQGRLQGRDPITVLEETCQLLVKRAKEVSATLAHNPGLKKAAENYIKGFLLWHIMQKRYRLTEIGIYFGPEPKK